MPVCRIQVEIVGADKDILRIGRFEYSYAAGLKQSYGVVDHVQQILERNVLQYVKRSDHRQTFIGKCL